MSSMVYFNGHTHPAVVTVGFGQMVYSVTERQNAEVILTITKTTLTDRTVSVMFSTLDGTALGWLNKP